TAAQDTGEGPTAAPTILATVDLEVEGMTCASCVARVERKLGKIPGVTATVNLPLESAHVQLTQDVATADLVKAVEAAGYGARLVARSDDGGGAGAPHHHAADGARDGGAGTAAHPAHDEAAAAGHAHAPSHGADGAPGADGGAGHDSVEHALSGHSMAPGHSMTADEVTSSPAERRGRDLRKRLMLAAWLTPITLLSMIPAWQFAGWQW